MVSRRQSFPLPPVAAVPGTYVDLRTHYAARPVPGWIAARHQATILSRSRQLVDSLKADFNRCLNRDKARHRQSDDCSAGTKNG